MAELDPEKILLEVETLKLEAASAHRNRREPGGRLVLVVLIVLILMALMAFSLWALSIWAERLPRPNGAPAVRATAQAFGDEAGDRWTFIKILLCPDSLNFLESADAAPGAA